MGVADYSYPYPYRLPTRLAITGTPGARTRHVAHRRVGNVAHPTPMQLPPRAAWPEACRQGRGAAPRVRAAGAPQSVRGTHVADMLEDAVRRTSAVDVDAHGMNTNRAHRAQSRRPQPIAGARETGRWFPTTITLDFARRWPTLESGQPAEIVEGWPTPARPAGGRGERRL